MMLQGTRVVEWSEGLSGPYCARILGDLGAEVCKIENPAGDPLRYREPLWPGEAGTEASALFAYLNAGKRSLTLDCAEPADRERLHAMLDKADVLIESQAEEQLGVPGLEISELRRRHKRLAVVSVTPWGRSGPLKNTAATDFTLQHRAALAHGMAKPVDDPEARGPLAGADHEGPLGVGVAAAMAAVWGLLVAQSGGRPPHVDLASYDFYAMIAMDALSEWLAGERRFSRQRVRKEGTEAAGGLTWILPCAENGWVMVSPREQHQWERWVALLGRPDWSDDAGLCATRVERRRHWSALQERMGEWTRRLPAEVVAQQAQAVSVACFPVSTPGALLSNAQLLHRQLFDRLVSPHGAQASVPGLPFRIETSSGNSLPRARTRQAPALGEANNAGVVR